MKSIIALFDGSDRAMAAARDLATHGIAPAAIHVDTPPLDHDVVDELRERNVPDDRVAIYAEAVRRGATLVIADTSDDVAEECADVLDAHGSLDVDGTAASWQGWAPPPPVRERSAEIPVVEEEARIGKREVESERLRVRTFVAERPVHESVTLTEERIDVAREPASESISPAAAEAAFTEREFEVTAKSEEPVVEKRAQVVEKVRIAKESETRTEDVEATERRQDVEIEREDPTRRR